MALWEEQLMPERDPYERTTEHRTIPPPAEASDVSAAMPVGTVVQASASGGQYDVSALHASGGLGEVYRAIDAELNREVALKCIQDRHAHNEQSRRRFLIEAEITARLEHPGVVPVYGKAVDNNGKPCYAMRFIEGESLSDAIHRFHGRSTTDTEERRGSERPSTPSADDFSTVEFRNLLQRFISVCNTVAYAHSRGVIHRDLKPQNVMLGKYSETLVVDWGLAKPIDSPPAPLPVQGGMLDETTVAPTGSGDGSETELGQAIGTPQFMSPEQAAGRWDVIGPPSDIYSLGATLYVLLTGQMPFREPNLSLLLFAVQEGEFASPRRRLASVPPALNAICLKAMSRKPEDRYQSALDLAADVESYLADEPLSVYREPFTARLRRWARKHRTLVATAAGIVSVAVLSLTISTVLLNSKNSQLERAYAAEQEARGQAEDREAETAAVLDFVQNKILAAARPEGQDGGLGRDVKLADAIWQSLPFVETSFKDQPLIEARLRMTLGDSFDYLGDPHAAIEQCRRARELFERYRGPDHPDTLQSMNNLASFYAKAGRSNEALALREETLRLRKAQLGPDHPDTLQSMSNLAVSYEDVGRNDEALALREKTLQLMKARLGPDHPSTLQAMNNLASSYAVAGRTEEALKLTEETYRLLRDKFGPDHPITLRSKNNVAICYTAAGHPEEAIAINEEILEIMETKLGPDHPSTLFCMNSLAVAYQEAGRIEDALALHEKNFRLLKAKLGPDHPDTLISMNNLSMSYATAGRVEEALALREETFRLMKARRGPDHPDTLSSMHHLAVSYASVGRIEEAVKLREETLRLQKSRLGPDHPDTLLNMNSLADLYMRLNRTPEALGLLQTALELWQRRADAQPGVPLELCFLAWTYGQIGQAKEEQQDYAAAREAYIKCVVTFVRLNQAGELRHAHFVGRFHRYRERLAFCQLVGAFQQDLAWPLLWGHLGF